MSPSRSAGRVPTAILIVTGLLVVGYVGYALRAGWPPRYLDEKQYLEIAANLSGGAGYQLFGEPTAYRPPAWPLLLAPFVAIGGTSPWLVLLPVTLMVLAACCAGLVTARITGSRWGWVALPLFLAYPLNLYTATTLYPQAFATFLLLALLLVVVRATDSWDTGPRLTVAGAALVGLLAAALALAVPTLILTGLAIGAWAVWQQDRKRLRTATTMAVAFLVPVGAWALRNLVVMGSPILFSTTSGENLLLGNNPTATADSGVSVDISAALEGARGMGEVDRDRYFQQLAIEWIRAHPADAFVLWLGKLANYFNPYNAPTTEGQGSSLLMVIGWVSFLTLMVAVIARFALRRRVPVWRAEILFGLLFVLNAPVMAVFFTRTRFRQPLDATLVPIAAVAVAIAISVALERRATRPRDEPDPVPPDLPEPDGQGRSTALPRPSDAPGS